MASARTARVRVYGYPTKGGGNNIRTFSLHHHPCLAPDATGAQNWYAVCKGKNTTLEEYLWKIPEIQQKRKINCEIEKPLMIQITYAVRHLHREERVVVPRDQEQILVKSNFTFSEDGSTVVLSDFKHDKESQPGIKRTNIGQLGVLFYWILSGQICCPYPVEAQQLVYSREKKIAADLIDRMQTSYTADDILRHPYFWSALKKLDFLSSVWHLYKLWEKNGKPGSTDLNDDITSLETKFPVKRTNPTKDGWKDQLIPRPNPEITNLDLDAVKELLDELNSRETYKYEGASAFHLIRFIRNCTAHFWDVRHTNARKLFSNNFQGLWRFFNGKFSDVFVSVYDLARKHRFFFKRLQRDYFSELAKFEDLVQI